MTQNDMVRWGILGPGGIARAFAGGLAHCQSGRLVAIGARNPDKPEYGEHFPGAHIHHGYDALLADPGVDAIYIATPHPQHAQWAIKAAEAGKHVLCEKPMGLTAFEADAMFHAARRAGTFMGEAFMYRLHPMTAKIVDLVASGAVGEVRAIKSSFGFAMPRFDPEHRLYANHLAGGGILDVGCYPVSMARLIAGAANGKPFLEPDTVTGAAHLGRTGVDEWAAAILKFPGGILAEVSCSISLVQDNMLRILGTNSRIEVKDFWFATGHEGGTATIDIIRPDGSRESIEFAEPGWLYAFEAEAASRAILAGESQFRAPGMSWADSLGNLRVLDKWRAAAGLEYEIEKPALRTHTLKGEPLAVKSDRIGRINLAGLARPISRLALGFEDFRSFSSAAILLDAFYEAGGNVFDTAFIYADGLTEQLLGDWQTSRGVRDHIAIIGKGAHSPQTYPETIAAQLDISLERLRTDHVDLYFMHRDNPAVPVGEFVDAMDAEVRRGRIRGPFGGSNWTRERFDEAVAYAERTGKTAPAILSNQFSLSRMLRPLWDGCVSAGDEDWRGWFARSGAANFAWSSQGRGFFTDRGADPDNEEIARTWRDPQNLARRERAFELADRLGRSPVQVALAYCLHQPFPLIPLIGPRSLAELDDSLGALDISLSPADIEWLREGSTQAVAS